VTGDAPAPAEHWTGRTRGGVFGNWLFIAVLRVLGLRAAYAFLAFVAAYFLLASRQGYRGSSDYLRRLLGPLPFLRRVWSVYRHYYSFGVMLLDRVVILSGREDRFVYISDGEENVRQAMAEGRGAIVLGAHAGSWEAAGHLLKGFDVIVNIVGVDREVESMRRMLSGAMSARHVRLIRAEGPFEHSVEILAALRRGEVVGILGDRAAGHAAVRANFLGKQAAFPAGAYLLAAVAGAPLIPVFSFRERGFRYRLIALPPERLQMPPRDQRAAFLDACVRRYVERLESMLRRYPYQWYNFYPFWDSISATKYTKRLNHEEHEEHEERRDHEDRTTEERHGSNQGYKPV
jgi:predicted LPLAT superfamily acyltransferase